MEPRDAEYREVTESQARRANRADWEAAADAYQAEHGEFLRDVGFVWCPEGLDEANISLLGDVSGLVVLEVGSGAGQCSRWLSTQGANVVGIDASFRQLQHSRRIDSETAVVVPAVCADVAALPFADHTFDAACSAFGALPFVLGIGAALAEVSRLLRPGALFVFSVVHPFRRAFPDDPSERGLTVTRSYFDRTPYVELDGSGQVTYVEPHHTVGDWVEAITGAGLDIVRIVEPEWPPGHTRVWGGWGPIRGSHLPGTAIFVTRCGDRHSARAD